MGWCSAYYIKNNECVNRFVAGRTHVQYRIDNADKIKQYRIDNADKITEQNKNYRVNNADKIKQYYVDNVDKIKEKIKQYQTDNADKIKQYRLDNAECIKEQRAVTCICQCGFQYRLDNKARHLRTKKHQSSLTSQTENKNL